MPIYVYTNISNNQFRSDADDDESAATATATENGLSGRPPQKKTKPIKCYTHALRFTHSQRRYTVHTADRRHLQPIQVHGIGI